VLSRQTKHTILIITGVFLLIAGFVLVQAQTSGVNKVSVKSKTASSAIITWQSDTPTLGMVTYSTDPTYGTVRETGSPSTDHSLQLTDLDPATTYYFRILSTDQSGNQNFSSDYTLTTENNPDIPEATKIKNPEQRQLAQKAIAIIEQLSEPTAVGAVLKKVEGVAEEVLDRPKMLGLAEITAEATRATVRWRTDKNAESEVQYAPDYAYRPADKNFSQSATAPGEVQNHEVVITGLAPDTTYYIRVASRFKGGPQAYGEIQQFTTKSLVPQINAIRIESVGEDYATIAWNTTILSPTILEYTNLQTKETKAIEDSLPVLVHSMTIPSLTNKTPYQVVIRAKAADGQESKSLPLTFTTDKDETPPVISRVGNESTLYPSEDNKIQTIISWETNKPSRCALSYTSGGSTKNEKDLRTLPEETGFLAKHVQVITEFSPATAYRFFVKCHDRNNNYAQSEDFVLFTPQREKSIIDIIMENFQGTFGWISNIGK